MNPLAGRLARLIETAGPITVADYMTAALGDPHHGYYRTADPLGAAGDFTTAPEISQLFGELIGAWLVDCWDRMGRPNPISLVELGPGRGTLMADALRASASVPGWREALQLHLVEINPHLRNMQGASLAAYAPHWHETLGSLPELPTLLVANEFFDALPIRQFVFQAGQWRERLVNWSAAAGFHFALTSHPSPLAMVAIRDLADVTENAVFEFSPAAIGAANEIGQRIARHGGGALVIDYGRTKSAVGESLQAVRRHVMVNVLENPGEADLSAHVDFGILLRAGTESGAAAFGPCTQGDFLHRLGIGERAAHLKRRASPSQIAELDSAVARLTAPSAMGNLFKVAVIAHRDLKPAGFIDEPWPNGYS
jgi:NADH dehydrogenase [ubiquinone] 1 alpha subcomplex assembly factor 7